MHGPVTFRDLYLTTRSFCVSDWGHLRFRYKEFDLRLLGVSMDILTSKGPGPSPTLVLRHTRNSFRRLTSHGGKEVNIYPDPCAYWVFNDIIHSRESCPIPELCSVLVVLEVVKLKDVVVPPYPQVKLFWGAVNTRDLKLLVIY